MPVMDGYEATRRIRRWELGIQNPRSKTETPAVSSAASRRPPAQPKHVAIIAMTARAFKADRQRCRQAGMDDFISKPIRRDRLLKTVDRWVKNHVPGTLAADGKPGAQSPPLPPDQLLPIDLPTAVEEFGSRQAVVKVADRLICNLDRQMDVMAQALDQSDAQRLQRESHAIKGGAWTVEARRLGDVAGKIEHHSRSHDLAPVGPCLKTLGRELERLKTYVTALRKGEENAYIGH